MRDLTEQEQGNINKYIDSISVKTGINIFNILDNLENDEAAANKYKAERNGGRQSW